MEVIPLKEKIEDRFSYFVRPLEYVDNRYAFHRQQNAWEWYFRDMVISLVSIISKVEESGRRK